MLITTLIESSASTLLALLESVVAFLSERLEVVFAVEQPCVSLVWDNVINYLGFDVLALVMRALAVRLLPELAGPEGSPSLVAVPRVPACSARRQSPNWTWLAHLVSVLACAMILYSSSLQVNASPAGQEGGW